MPTLEFKFKVEGVLANATSVVLSDPTGAFGVKRNDTDAVVVADGTAMTNVSTGVYRYTFTAPAAGLTYTWFAEAVYNGATYRFEREFADAVAADVATYCDDATEANSLAASLPSTMVASYTAATDDQKLAARVMAALRIDAAHRYQGRKYGPAIGEEQVREFPRIAYEQANASTALGNVSGMPFAEVWDWDSDANEAVVPRDVKLAEILEANSILAGTRDASMQARADGLASQSVGGMSESYRDVGSGSSASGVPTLSRDADALMKKYRLRSGQMR